MQPLDCYSNYYLKGKCVVIVFSSFVTILLSDTVYLLVCFLVVVLAKDTRLCHAGDGACKNN